MRGKAATIGDYGRGTREEQRPGWRRGLSHQHLPRLEVSEVLGAAHNVDAAGGATGARWLTNNGAFRHPIGGAHRIDQSR